MHITNNPQKGIGMNWNVIVLLINMDLQKIVGESETIEDEI
ncbi:hypothetical protein SAMN04487900_11666 [Prevotella communis]|uniref:Uncharacterized protein n=1 Tax=Prevotella communis TaxID=2913614 RepID=A0A1H0IS74_9BACT|nr:hypothetical protein SAMN04487900_11666 [Prevotella communis]